LNARAFSVKFRATYPAPSRAHERAVLVEQKLGRLIVAHADARPRENAVGAVFIDMKQLDLAVYEFFTRD
jgi:hypothetical protein